MARAYMAEKQPASLSVAVAQTQPHGCVVKH